jgi:hypothetical protein
LNKLSKAMRDSPRRVFLNSTTQDRTPWDDLSRPLAVLILDRVSGTLRSAFLMSLIARIVFVFASFKKTGCELDEPAFSVAHVNLLSERS